MSSQPNNHNSKNVTKIHAFTDDILGDLDASDLANLIRSKAISSQEVLSATIDRANKVDGLLNAVVSNRYQEQLNQTSELNKGFFAGVPTYFKDLTNILGIPTYFGSKALKNVSASKITDPIAEQILNQGFVHIGNSSMSEFGFTCSTESEDYHDTRNPWNINHTPGGSSGGSAALVAAGVVPIAHAADGGGSIRIPAAACGLVGLKPSRGRLLNSKLFEKQPVHIAVDGVISRTVRDTAKFYAEAEKHYKNKKLPAIGSVDQPTKKSLTIGFTADSINNLGGDEVSRNEMEKTLKLLESLGHTVKPVQLSITDTFVDDFSLVWAMNAFFMHRFGKMLFDRSFVNAEVSQLTKELSKYYTKNIHKTPFVAGRMKKTKHQYAAMFNDLNVDLFLTPTVASSAPEIGYFDMNLEFEQLFNRIISWTCFTPYSNASGGPSISLPLGFDKDKQLPIGMLFWANHGQEKLLLELALQLEEANPWKKITED
ncbi:MAG: amidase [Flavobacteriales bacterium]|nr:amidase [Flavobacteriales bacterium]